MASSNQVLDLEEMFGQIQAAFRKEMVSVHSLNAVDLCLILVDHIENYKIGIC